MEIVSLYMTIWPFSTRLNLTEPEKKQLEDFPMPIIADEIHIRVKEKEKSKESAAKKTNQLAEKKRTWQEMAWIAAKALGVLLVFIFLLPLLFLIYCLLRIALSKNNSSKADHVYRAALYRFHMAGLEREGETPLEYAQQKVDPATSAGFESFMHLYLRLKYSKGTLQEGDAEHLNRFNKNIGSSIHKKFGFSKTALNYLNVLRASRYIQPPQKFDYENQSL